MTDAAAPLRVEAGTSFERGMLKERAAVVAFLQRLAAEACYPESKAFSRTAHAIEDGEHRR